MASIKTGTWTNMSQMVSVAMSRGSFQEQDFSLTALSFLGIISCLRLVFLSAVRGSPQMLCSHPCKKRGELCRGNRYLV